MKYYKIQIVVLVMLIFSLKVFSQDDLLEMLDNTTNEETIYTTSTFKATRIINGHSVEQMKAKHLDVRIHHRFGAFSTGSKQFWGLDQSNILLSLEYGLTNNLMVGLGRTNVDKTVNSFLKYNIITQCSGKKNYPFTMVFFSSMTINTDTWPYIGKEEYFSSRLNYSFQVLVARKLTEKISLQLTPSLVHRNLVYQATDMNDIFALGTGGRIKISRRLSITGECFFIIKPFYNYNDFAMTNSFSLGLDIETGGHVFQIVLTNSQAMLEPQFIGETYEKWNNGGIRLGFNISRVFSL